jgi:maltose alpha-D-glucosyltransferase / alpha-amylase
MTAQKYWWKEAKIYELYIDKFAGDIKGLTAELDYFTALGVNCLHLLPHYPSPMIDDGYDVTDYKGIRPELGTLDDFAELVRQAAARDIRIVIDWVSNHTSTEHPWFEEARSSKDNPYRDFYLWSETGTEFARATNAFPDIKESDWIYNPRTEDYYFATFYPEQPDLNWDEPRVFAEMIEAMNFWIELGVSGFRLDAARHLIKRDGTDCVNLPETHAILKRMRAHLEERGFHDVILIAEAVGNLDITKAYFGTGDECHMVYHFGLAEQMWLALAKGDTTRFERIVEDSRSIPENCQWVVFLRNHDEIALGDLDENDRAALMEFLDPKKRYWMQKANLTSMRVAEVFGGDTAKIRAALEMLYKAPGAHVMYYGDEIGMRNLERQDGIVDTRKYVRGAFDRETAHSQMKDPESLFNEVAKLVRSTNAEVVHVEEILPEPPEEHPEESTET